jgi:hypothetical protein
MATPMIATATVTTELISWFPMFSSQVDKLP